MTSDTAAASVLKFLKRDVAVFMVVELVERPLPKPSSEGYIEARLLEALGETRLALEYLERGLTRNAAGKAFQAWKALLAALLRLELEKLKALAKTEEEKRWLESRAVPRVPTTRMNEAIKSITLRLSAGKRDARLSQPRAPATHRRRQVAPRREA